jgi:capsular polysaccharide biosynthesis protein
MQETHYIGTLLLGWKRILSFAAVSAVVGVALSFAFPLQYSSTLRLLIIQRQLSTADPYTAIKASERISENLSQAIYTTSFFDKVLETDFDIDRTVFKADEHRRRRQWERMVGTQVLRGSGMIVLTAYHTDKDEATKIANAIAYVLTTEGWQYVGGGDLEVKIVDEPLQSRFPVKPNIPANAFMGFALGLIAGSGYVLMTAERKGLFGIPK